jgi:very-short-patch-repair endonuclease
MPIVAQRVDFEAVEIRVVVEADERGKGVFATHSSH